LQPEDLDVVGLVAVLGEPVGIVGDEGKRIQWTLQPDVGAGWIEGEPDSPEPADAVGQVAGKRELWASRAPFW